MSLYEIRPADPHVIVKQRGLSYWWVSLPLAIVGILVVLKIWR